MKSIAVASVSLFLLARAGAEAQHHAAMHLQSGPGGYSACVSGRYDGPVRLYPPAEAGKLNHKVSTANAEAQQYFNQGLTFLYGFDSESAMRSFNQAAIRDPKLAMAYWGLSLAAGGDLNIPIDDPCMVLAVSYSKRANDLRGGVSEAERLYIDALSKRYATDTPTAGRRDPQQLSVYYMLEMKEVARRLGANDPDARALYAYSLMNLRPWLWWTTSGKKSAEIEAALATVRSVTPFPDHIGLHHINIHAQEEGPVDQASQALPSAQFLVNNAPAITPHLSHMPAHIHLLMGNWEGVVQANRKALDMDLPWVDACHPSLTAPGCNPLLVGHYYSHDMLFLSVGFANQGIWEYVDQLNGRLEDNVRLFLDGQPGLEHYLTTRAAMSVLFGRWQDLAALKPPQDPMPDPASPNFCSALRYKLAAAMWYFGRAMGKASLGQPTDAEVYGFTQAQSCVQAAGTGWGNNTAFDILKVVRWRMLERIARKKGLRDASQQFALLAVETEDLLDYDEPPGWYLSSRVNYGAALFLSGKYEEAKAVFQEDLKRRPGNSRSL